MFTFDFDNGGGFNANSGVPVSNVDGGVRFTVSPAGGGSVIFPNILRDVFGGVNLLLTDSLGAGGTTFTLTLQSTANASQTLFTANPTVPVVLNLGNTRGGAGNFSGGPWNITFLTEGGGTGPQFSASTGNENFTVTSGTFSGIRFSSSDASDTQIIAVETLTVAALACFCAGTMIATPRGERAVETLKSGDVILKADGQPTRVRWLGRQTVSTVMNAPDKVNPVCISAGALGGGLPERDLCLSKDHAVEIGGVLYNAGTLVNGSTIYRVREMPETFTYYHIETETHEVILAEGVAAETYFDDVAEEAFDNKAEREARRIPEMPLPRVSSARLVPEHLRLGLLPAKSAA